MLDELVSAEEEAPSDEEEAAADAEEAVADAEEAAADEEDPGSDEVAWLVILDAEPADEDWSAALVPEAEDVDEAPPDVAVGEADDDGTMDVAPALEDGAWELDVDGGAPPSGASASGSGHAVRSRIAESSIGWRIMTSLRGACGVQCA